MDVSEDKKYAILERQKYVLGDYSLVTIQPDDIEDIREWRNAQLDVLRQSTPISSEQQIEYFSKIIWPSMDLPQPKNILFTFFKNGQRIGYGGLVHISWSDKRAELSFLLDPKYGHRDDDYAKHFLAYIHLILGVAFGDLKFHRVFAETYSFRKTHISILEKADFKFEGAMRDHVLVNGTFFDSLLHGILNNEGNSKE
ncbi:MAG: GNAT family N-acetyltransferase [Minisyncoccia bacterium]|jgi:RimJ/RimL family protein N-acetyltransferase